MLAEEYDNIIIGILDELATVTKLKFMSEIITHCLMSRCPEDEPYIALILWL